MTENSNHSIRKSETAVDTDLILDIIRGSLSIDAELDCYHNSIQIVLLLDGKVISTTCVSLPNN